ncbi:MAG: penicillin acylase family protein [Pseudomonadota bacterium]
MSRPLRWFLYSVLVLLLIAVIGGGGAYLWFSRSLPQVSGERILTGLTAPVSLERDAQGLVTIRAENETDAYFALGFAHAQDRLWQMDSQRRTASGRLSEVIGSSTLEIDRFIRTLGLYRVAEANLKGLGADVRGALESYSAGVNAFLTTRSGPLPPEFFVLGYEPEPWRPVDSLLWGKLMAFQLSGNWHEELLRARLDQRLDPAKVEALWPPYPADSPVVLADQSGGLLNPQSLTDLAGLIDRLPSILTPKDASNSWVLSGARTATGSPILANDPHLELTAPSTWYMVRIETPSLTLAGATAPGVPFIIIGHNSQVAWGFTTTHSDTQDLFVERLAAGSQEHYDTPDGPTRFESHQEVIQVEGDSDHTMTVRHSRHGPIMNDVASRSIPNNNTKDLIALSWPALREDDRTPQALYGINHARNWETFNAALEDFHTPQQNIVYADVTGNIGFVAPGRVPIRRSGDGRRPVSGWSGDFDWEGFIPFDELPRAFNPETGKIVAANNKVVGEDYPYLITANWPNGDRAQRVEDLLAAAPSWSLEQSQDMQLDTLSLGAQRLLPLLLAAPTDPDFKSEAMELLKNWDGHMDVGRPEPLIYYTWIWALTELILADDLGPDFAAFQRGDARLLATLLSDQPHWCDHSESQDKQETCEELIVLALENAFDALTGGFSRDELSWRWGDAHIAHFPHPVWSRLPFIDDLINYGLEAPGGNDTLNRGSARFRGEAENRFEDVHGPGMRVVFDLANLNNSRFNLAGGQSGNPLSPHYGDLVVPWRDGLYFKLDGAATPKHQLTLLPP